MRAKTTQPGRKKTAIGVVVLGLILSAIILHEIQDEKDPAISAAAVGQTETAAAVSAGAAGEPADNSIFTAQNFDSVMMFGSPRLWDDEKNLSIDLDDDGISEEFVISKDFSDNIILEGIQRDAQGK